MMGRAAGREEGTWGKQLALVTWLASNDLACV
jgi:hypothetical protein